MSAPQLGIAIVNYRAGALTAGCLSSLAAERRNSPEFCVYVVDNASGDDSARRIEDAIAEGGWGTWITFIQSDTNGGFAAGNNIAIRRMLSAMPGLRYILLLNPDTVVRPGAIAKLCEFMDAHAEVGIGGGRSEDPDGTPQVCCFRFPSLINEFANRLRLGLFDRLIGPFRTHVPIPDRPLQIDWVSGACMIVRRDVIDAIGLLDEAYFLYFEETDFILRARRAHWSCWHLPDARVVHYVGQSTGVTSRDKRGLRTPAYWFESRRRYFILNHGLFYALLTDMAVVLATGVWKVRRLLGARSDGERPHELRDFVMHSSLMRQRRGIVARRVA